jgi:L-glyceraldehyde 3-phosphate reductase
MYVASENRYDGNMPYIRCGKSGIKLPLISLGLWHNFGSVDVYSNAKEIALTAFDGGVTHFDLANNYGPVPGSAEETFGKILKDSLLPYRDELIVSTKAGYYMWPGPYGEWGSRKNLIASCDQSLKRMNLDYVDIFYHHRPDPETPLEETMQALDYIVRSGRALYIGISNYSPEMTVEAYKILKELKTPLLIHQFPCSMLRMQNIENNLTSTLDNLGVGGIAFSPLAQGILTGKYLNGIPKGSRAEIGHFLKAANITEEIHNKVAALQEVANLLGVSLTQLALLFLASQKGVTSILCGAHSKEQMLENMSITKYRKLEDEVINKILDIVK